MNDVWEIVPSNDFATIIYNCVDHRELVPPPKTQTQLCSRCNSMEIWSGSFSTSDKIIDLRREASRCTLCALFYGCAESSGKIRHDSIQFYRVGSTFRLESDGPAVLSICTTRTSEKIPPYVQIGFPLLPQAGSQVQFELMRQWLRLCNRSVTHKCNPTLDGQLPTRVLDVGTTNHGSGLYLHCSDSNEKGRYLALSHRWESSQAHRPFFTSTSHLVAIQKHIDFKQLPRTFQDAFTVTRQLGIRFLWIDSICIVQDDAKDWDKESKLMEKVFASAYCTIAASRAKGSSDGFLTPRHPRNAVRVRPKSGHTYYVSDAIDDFHHNVEEGELNKRGWVLQERALSHRTIYFTETQVYWECGNGVHCETLTKLRNPKSGFLGDSEFPKSAEMLYKGGRIRLYEEVYKRYSRLAFTYITDRAIAISGLEKRLIQAFNTRGGYGLFAEYFHRSLLWQRASPNLMNTIQYDPSAQVPSWSWMAYDGPITYVNILFGKVEWYKKNVKSPFRTDVESIGTNDLSSEQVLLSSARDFWLPSAEQGLTSLIFDTRHFDDSTGLKCVVIARDSISVSEEPRKYYVLVIAPEVAQSGPVVYRRVGAGFVEERQTCLESSSFEARIE